MRQRLVRLAATLSVASLAFPAYAHHSHPFFYDECTTITIEGRVESVDFKEPHTQLVLKMDDGTAYTVDWAPLGRLTKDRTIGPAKEALAFGARVAVTGNRIRPAAQIRERFANFNSEVNPNTVDPISIRRLDDSFSWALPPRTNPPNCDRKQRAGPASRGARLRYAERLDAPPASGSP